jgi:hypothetical protein
MGGRLLICGAPPNMPLQTRPAFRLSRIQGDGQVDYRGVQLRVLEADALSYETDLLVLKHAQRSYGVDAKAVQGARINVATLPAVGENLLVRAPSRVGPRNLLFIGVEPIHFFGYQFIRYFSRRAIAQADEALPSVREIAMTMHGIGFGLDETEAFESEVAGVIEALDADDYPHGLLTVTFVEQGASRAARMKNVLASLLGATEPRKRPETGTTRGVGQPPRRIDTVGYDSAARPHAFVAMPFTASFEDVFYYGISRSIRAAGLLCERVDQIHFTGDIIDRVKERIASSTVVVADLSDANPNVYLEVGYAWGVRTPCVLICNRQTDLKFDLRGERCLFYGSIMELEKTLSAELAALSAQIPSWRPALHTGL